MNIQPKTVDSSVFHVQEKMINDWCYYLTSLCKFMGYISAAILTMRNTMYN